MRVVRQEPPELVKRVKVMIGDDWTEHSFACPVPRAQAVQRARLILEALA